MKTKHELRKEIARAMFDTRYAEINFGYDSQERIEAIKRHAKAQIELGALELGALAKRTI